MPNIIYYSCDDFFQTTLDYLYDKHEDKIEDFVQKRANKQAMKMSLVYDALIVNGWDNSYAIRFK